MGWDEPLDGQPVPSFRSPDAELNAIACAHEDSCTAVGFTQERARAW
jgi:hypothetical protein